MKSAENQDTKHQILKT